MGAPRRLKPETNMQYIIHECGGIQVLAQDLGISHQTIRAWWRRGTISRKNKAILIEHAKKHGVDESRFIYL